MTKQATVMVRSKEAEVEIKTIKLSDIPVRELSRGRESFVVNRPFWKQLVAAMAHGIGANEAVEIDLVDTYNDDNEPVPAVRLAERIRHQFKRNNYHKDFSLLWPKQGKKMYVMNHHETVEG